jgi:hypothetical protein
MDLPYVSPLGQSQLAAAGLEGHWVLGHRDKVRFSEIDQLNHVNNVAYLRWFEVLRVRYFVMWGMTRYAPGCQRSLMCGRPQRPRSLARATFGMCRRYLAARMARNWRRLPRWRV